MYYGQSQEDAHIEQYFPAGFKGVCIDVGANEPISGSNTYYFEQKGWNAYCIEPNPQCIENLKAHRANVFNFAASDQDNEDVTFTVCTLRGGNQGAISSLVVDEKLLADHASWQPELVDIKVQTKKLDTFIEENQITSIDFISIDTEGTELDVLKGLDLIKYSPKLLIIENNHETPDITEYLDRFGYTKDKRISVNDFYIKKTNTKKYLAGGRLGDFINSLIVCKRIFEKSGEKAILYIGNIGDSFENSLEFTYNELKPILEKQEWLSDFRMHQGEAVDINLSEFRQSPHLYHTNWLNIFFKTFLNEDPINEYKWIDIPKNQNFSNSLVVNRSVNRYGYGQMASNVHDSYKRIISEYESRYFVCFDKSQYDSFEFKNEFELILVKDLYEYFEIINSCKLFIGNQSGPFAWASAMNVPRFLEILRSGDYISRDGMHYVTDYLYYKNFSII